MFEIDEVLTKNAGNLWREHADELVRFATVLVGSTDAYDVVVDAFVRVVRQTHVEDLANVRAYLFRAVVNQSIDMHRATRRRRSRDVAAILPVSAAISDPLIDVRRAVAALSVAQRAVVYFVYWEDRTERQTAEILGISHGTVSRHLNRAQAHLRKALQ